MRPTGTSGWQATPGELVSGVLRTPSPARMYDYYLGGKDNYEWDREAADRALSLVPSGRELARANRDFLARAIRHVAEHGVGQFIDVGTGMPTSPNVHEVARKVNPAARVAYVDNDAVVVAHDRALLAGHDGITALHGDIRNPAGILDNPDVRSLIDFTRPFAVLFVASLHFVTDAEGAHASVAYFRERMPPDSYLILSHITSDNSHPGAVSAIQDAYKEAAAPAVFRTARQVGEFFDGFQLMDPGIVNVSEWRPDARRPLPAPAVRFLAGVAKKAGH